MKKIYLAVLAILFTTASASAQVLKVDDVEALAGETVSFTLQLDCAGGSYTGMEFDIQFPNGNFTTTRQATTAEGWDGAFSIGDVGSFGENLSRSGVLSYSDTPIPGTGMNELGSVEVTVGASTPLGEYDVTITGVTMIGEQRIPAADASFKIKVVERHTVILDETSTTMPVAATDVIAVVKRTIKANEWSTICLPFAMTEEQTKAAFGGDVEINDFQGCETTENEDEEITAILVKFAPVTEMEANHPYVIKVTEPISEFTIEGVDIEPEEEVSLDMDELRLGSGTKKDPYRYYYNSFIGTYVANTEVPENMLFISENKFWYSTGSARMKAFRGYFDFYDVLTDVENAQAKIGFSFVDSSVDSINGTVAGDDSSEDKVYTIDGVLVGKGISLKQLPKGVYIVKGKKLVIK